MGVVFSHVFEVDSNFFEISILNNYTIVLENISHRVNEYGFLLSTTERSEKRNVAIRVYKKTMSVVEEWIHENRPPYIRWDTGFDDSRISLYDRIGKKLDRLGYMVVKNPDDPSFYYAYRIKK